MVRASICDDDVIVAQKLKLIIEKEFLSRNIDFMCDISMPLSQLFEVLFDSSVVVKYPIF